ncbi:MAG: hypothetical protein ABEK16_03065 [Candidatus Nanohalobium sp.]
MEAFIRAYHIDEKYPEKNLEEKNQLLADIRNGEKSANLSWKKLVGKYYSNTNFEDDLGDLYGKLCKYVHSSPSEWEEDVMKNPAHRTTPLFNEKAFDRTQELTEQFLAALTLIFLERYFPQQLNDLNNLEKIRKQIFSKEKPFPVQI